MKRKSLFLALALSALAFGALLFTACQSGPFSFTKAKSVDPVEMESLQIGFQKAFSREIELRDCKVVWFPDTEDLAMSFRSGVVTYYQFWNTKQRAALKKAIEKYKNTLETNGFGDSAVGKRTFGSTKISATWGLIANFGELGKNRLASSAGSPLLYFGFTKIPAVEAPFFTITQASTLDEKAKQQGLTIYSEQVFMYFTPNAADAMLQRISDAEIFRGIQ
ncbi:MAG: hypothetical protein LBM77_10775 [Spirochaetaceae bacterium]|jgi:hypothetical protein|nr:hypothetical protein [Spirochaetaceae bacterium]